MTVLFYPNLPGVRWSIIYKYCQLKGWEISNDPNAPYDLAIHWQDTTHRRSDEVLEKLKKTTHVINGECADISKRRIDRAHQEVFGYSLIIDPVTFSGLAVRKSDVNATHNGEIVTCPLTIEERDAAMADGWIFSRLLNTATVLPNLDGREYARDIRVPFMGGEIPLCYLGYRELDSRFGFKKVYVDIVNTADVLSAHEVSHIGAFCSAIGLEYGELDVLRNLDDGCIYIVDANNTPSGPQEPLLPEQTREVVARLADSFEQNFVGKK